MFGFAHFVYDRLATKLGVRQERHKAKAKAEKGIKAKEKDSRKEKGRLPKPP